MLRQVTVVVQDAPPDDDEDTETNPAGGPQTDNSTPTRDTTVVHKREQKEQLKSRMRSIDNDRGRESEDRQQARPAALGNEKKRPAGTASKPASKTDAATATKQQKVKQILGC